MGVMLIAPEFLTTFTTKKMLGTKKNVAELKRLAGDEIEWGLPQTILADPCLSLPYSVANNDNLR